MGEHRFSIEHLLGEFGDGDDPIGGRAPRGQGHVAGYEEMKPRERHHVDLELSQIGVQLTGESETGRYP